MLVIYDVAEDARRLDHSTVKAKTHTDSHRQKSPRKRENPEWDPAGAIAVLRKFMEGDEEEQTETFEALKRGLDEGRPEGQKLFS
jgi:hypothetical protein